MCAWVVTNGKNGPFTPHALGVACEKGCQCSKSYGNLMCVISGCWEGCFAVLCIHIEFFTFFLGLLL